MTSERLKVLLIVEQCNPEWASVPLVGYRFFHEISRLVDVTLVTHERNRTALEKYTERAEIIYLTEGALNHRYYKFVDRFAYQHRVIWPLYHALTYPIYAEFNHAVHQQFKQQILQGEFDLIHALTPIMPRYPVKVVNLCRDVPFLLGPVNGGVPFPVGFQDKAKREFASLNFLRSLGRLFIPGYIKTYRNADRVLSGSTYTMTLIQEMFQLPDDRISLFYENGVPNEFFVKNPHQKKQVNGTVNLLFVGRLVPYKCADILIEAVSRLTPATQAKLRLTIVGDGSERGALEAQAATLGLTQLVDFTGWVDQQKIPQYYQDSHIFCFPSIREFGGAVVLEAMACGLPCIVANHGGIGEYVTSETGFKIDPISREYLTQELTAKIQLLVENAGLRQAMAEKAIERAQEFSWEYKGKKMLEIYQELITQKKVQPAKKVQPTKKLWLQSVELR
jgi:glycosyltransferase involved in cell wall biosynthesis